MSMEDGSLSYSINIDTSQLENGTRRASKAFSDMSNDIESASKRINQSMQKISGTSLTDLVMDNIGQGLSSNLAKMFGQIDRMSQETFGMMSEKAQRLSKDIQEDILSLKQVEVMQSALNDTYESGKISLDEYLTSQARLSVLYEQISNAIQSNEGVLKSEMASMEMAEDSISSLQAKVSLLSTEYMKLSAAQREGTEGQAVLKNLNDVQVKLQQATASMNQYARAAGSKFDGLNFSVQQLARELPVLAVTPSMFFLAISNNLPIFADELAKARKEYQLLNEAGKSATPVWKRVVSSLFSWQTALVGGITLLSIYGDEIAKWIGSLFSAEKALSDTYQSLDEWQKKVGETSGSTIAVLEKLSQGWKRLGDDMQAKEQYIIDNRDAINSLGVVINDTSDAERVFSSNKDAFIRSILERAKAVATMDLAAEEYKKAIQKMMEADAKAQEGASFGDYFKSWMATAAVSEDMSGTLRNADLSPEAYAKESEKKKREASLKYFKSGTDLIQKYIQFSEEESKILEEAGISSTKKMIDGSVEAIEAAIAIKKDALKKATSKEEYREIEAQIAAEQAKLDAITGSKRGGTKTDKTYNDIVQMRRDMILKVSESGISAMKEGFLKRLKEIELERAQTIAAIDKEQKDLENKLGKVGQSLSADDKTKFQIQRDNANAKAVNATREAEEENAEYIKGLYENLADVFVSEEERKLNAIRNTYQEQRKQLGKDLAGRNITQEQYNDLSGKINAAEAQEMANMWISAYGDYYQKREQLQREWEARLAVIPVEYQEEAVKKYKEALSNLDVEANKTTSAISLLFGDMKDKTLKELEEINAKGQAALEFLKTGVWDDSKGKEFGISKETFDIWSKSPEKLKDISDALRDNRRAADELRPALEQVVNGLHDLFNPGGDPKKINQALSNIQDGLGKVMQAASFLSETFSHLGESFGSGAMSGIADGLNVAMDSVNAAMQGAQAAASLGLGGIGMAAGAATGLVTSLASAIAKIHDKKNEKRIQALQDQIDALDRSYEKLGESIEESYSKDASKLIEQNNKLLEQQKVLIQQQIREEEDKKKTDDERIKEWQQQIEDINDLIEDNKEKAVDAIFGETLQSAIENFADAYAEAWANGEDRAESAKDTVKKMMQQMVTESIKAAIQSSNSMERIRQKLQEFYADNVLSGWEQDYIYNMAEQLQQEINKQFGWADSLMNEGEYTQEATKKGFATASQESIDELNGRFAASYVAQVETKDIMRETANSIMVIRSNMDEIKNISLLAVGHLEAISKNTKELYEMNERLNKIEKNTRNL